MNIVILSGGTGSIALQQGLHNVVESHIEGVDVKVIVNAYDNGLSTGAVRKVMNGCILGPSDVRKNQTTRYRLKHGHTPLLDFLEIRFTSAPDKAYEYCLDALDELDASGHVEMISSRKIKNAIDEYFRYSAASQIDYSDFSLANIIYAGLAAQNGNSMRAAAKVMAGILDIPDNVLVNDDTSLFLGAITKSGKRLDDEGDIVTWNNPNDPIVDVFFIDSHGNEAMPVLNDECKAAIANADMIIMSSGTQWSSLIPTYASIGFKEAIQQSSAKILMVMNRIPDKDAPDQSASDIINTLVPKYFDNDRIHLILDSTSHTMMNRLEGDACLKPKTVNWFDMRSESSTALAIELPKNVKHGAENLAKAVLKTYFRDLLAAKAIIFDYDDTLVGRGNSFPKSSKYNSANFAMSRRAFVCTGNSIKAIKLNSALWTNTEAEVKPITIFADGGINEYSYDPFSPIDEDNRAYRFVKCLDENSRFDSKGPNSAEQVVQSLRAAGIPSAKIEIRGDVMVTIKPVDPEYREIVANLVKYVCEGSPFNVTCSGRTTIEINKASVRKDIAINTVLKSLNFGEFAVYVGDELDSGNDLPAKEIEAQSNKLICYPVKNPSDTALLIMALNL